MYECDQHPRSLEEVSRPTAVRSQAFRLTGEVGDLVRCASKALDKNAYFGTLREAFSRSVSVALCTRDEPHMVANAPLPSHWITDYKLQVKTGGLRQHNLDGFIHFGEGHSTPEHFEECAAATYGCLVQRTKYWTFTGPNKEKFTYIQHEGHTVYIPPGWLHSVKTLSNDAILLGGTAITAASPAAFVLRGASLVNGPIESRHNPEPEAELLCERFAIPVSSKLKQRKTDWYAGPTMTALRRYVAKQSGGTRRLDKLGRRKRRKIGSR